MNNCYFNPPKWLKQPYTPPTHTYSMSTDSSKDKRRNTKNNKVFARVNHHGEGGVDIGVSVHSTRHDLVAPDDRRSRDKGDRHGNDDLLITRGAKGEERWTRLLCALTDFDMSCFRKSQRDSAVVDKSERDATGNDT